jgi:hypothetical protein
MSNGLVRFAAASASAAALLVFGLNGTASAPPAGAPVRIIDADDSSLAAHVDANGNLQVGGTVGIDPEANFVTVDSSTPVLVTSVDDPGRAEFHVSRAMFHEDGDGGISHAFIEVPAGKRLVITFVSGRAVLPGGQKLIDVSMETTTVGNANAAVHRFVPSFTGTTTFLGPIDHFVFSQDTQIYADGRIAIFSERSDDTVSGSVHVSISGYLIDCSVAPCS